MISTLNKKISWLLPLFMFVFLVVGFGVEAVTQINFEGFSTGGSTCTGGASGACQNLVNNNTAVGLSPDLNPDFYKIMGSEGLGPDWQPDGTFELRGTIFGTVSGNNVLTSGYIWNPPGGDAAEYEAQYSCSVNGSIVPTPPVPLSSDGSWSASLPDNASCDLEIVPRGGVTIPPSGVTACDGTPGNPCYVGMCQTGQCRVITQYPNGDPVLPGDRSQCAVSETDCLTHFTISVSPVNATVNTGASAVYAVTFNFNGNKPYPSANIAVSAPGLSDSNNNFQWSGTGLEPTSKTSVKKLSMVNTSTGAIDQTKTVFLTVNNAPIGSYNLTFSASTGDASGVNADQTLIFVNCFGNCNPTANATLTVQTTSCASLITNGPTNLQCGAISPTGFTATWNPATGTFDNHYVRVSTSYDGVASGICAVPGSPSYDPVNCVNNLSTSASSFPATNLQPSTLYYYRVAAACVEGGVVKYKDTPVRSCTTGSGGSCIANPVVTSYTPNPAVLSSVPGTITVNWATVVGATSYRVELENTDTGITTTNNNVPGGTTNFSVSPDANGTTYKVRVYSNVSGSDTACAGVSEYVITVYRPGSSCPGTAGTVVLNKSSAVLGDVTVKATSPAGYNCNSFSSNDTGIVDVVDDPAIGNPSYTFLTLNGDEGTANISASGCVYQNGPVCPVNSAPLTVTNTAPGGSYDFSLSTTSIMFYGLLNPGTGVLESIPNASMNVTANVANPGSLYINFPWRMVPPEGSAAAFSDDDEINSTGYYNLSPGASWSSGNNIFIQDVPAIRFPGNYTEVLTYAGYTDAIDATSKVTANKSVTINLQVKTLTSENTSYTVSPANLTFPTSGATTRNGSLPPSQNIVINNTGATTLNIGVAESIAWAGFTIVGGGPNPFALAPGNTKTITVSMNTTNPLPDTETSYTGAVNFTESVAGDKSVGVTYNFAGGGGSCTPVSGGWTAWSECSSGTRTRTCTNPVPSCGGSICSGASSEACTNNPQQVKVTPGYCGYVTSVPAGIDCGVGGRTSCEATFPQDIDVVLTAHPSPGARCVFIEWQGNCNGSATNCNLFINGAKNVTPIFGLKPFFYQEF